MTFKFRFIAYSVPEKTELMPTVILCVDTPVIRQVLLNFTKHKMPLLIFKAAFPTTEILGTGNLIYPLPLSVP